MKQQNITKIQRLLIVEMRDNHDMSFRAIARTLSLSTSGIWASYHRSHNTDSHKHRLAHMKAHDKALGNSKASIIEQNRTKYAPKHNHYWTKRDYTRLNFLESLEHNDLEIAHQMQRSVAAIRNRRALIKKGAVKNA